MDFGHIGRNDPCPCGSGKKFKKCHLGREDEIKPPVEDKLVLDPEEAGERIAALPEADHAQAKAWAAQLDMKRENGQAMGVKLVDMAAYAALPYTGQDVKEGLEGGVMINPYKTRLADPDNIYIALTPKADESTVLHQLAHAMDYVAGSRVSQAQVEKKLDLSELPRELLEHPQEYGEILVDLAKRFGVQLDAEDEIVSFLASRQMLLPGELVRTGKRNDLINASEKTMRFLQDSQAEIDARIKSRPGYTGASGK